MRSVQVNVHINAPIEQVFEAISDHEQFLKSADGTRTKLLQEGNAERNGLGCVREVRVGKRAWYVEEITAWNKPAFFEYTVRRASMPISHEGSSLTFTEVSGGTHVQWSSRFSIPVPILGGLLGAAAERLYSKAFTALLETAKVQLERSSAAAGTISSFRGIDSTRRPSSGARRDLK